MPDQLQLRGGTTTQHGTFTGASKEVTVDTTKKTAVVHDGSTVGGNPLMREDGSNSALALGSQGTPSLKFTGDPNTGIYSPGADQVAISTNGTGRLFVNSDGTIDFGTTSGTATPTVKAAANPVLSFSNGTNSAYVGLVGVNNRLLNFSTNGTTLIQSDSTINLNVVGSNPLTLGTGNTERLRITSTGALNFVGAGTAGSTQAVSFNGSAPVNSLVIDSSGRVGVGTSVPAYNIHGTGYLGLGVQASAGAGAGIHMIPSSSATNWFVGANYVNTGTFQIIPSTTGGGSTFTTPALTIDSSSRVGVGTTSPAKQLHIESTSSDVTLRIGRNGYVQTDLIGSTGAGANDFKITQNGFDRFVIEYGGNSAARIDGSGRLLVGTSSTFDAGCQLQVVGNITQAAQFFRIGGSDNTTVYIGSARGTTGTPLVLASTDIIGTLAFRSYDGSAYANGATIKAEIDGITPSSDLPTRLVFSTTADGASSPTERMRISNTGVINTFNGSGDSLNIRSGVAAGTSTGLIYGLYSATGISNGTTSFIVWSNGNVVNTNNSYGAISDIKLKENIVDANSQWDDLKALQVRNYNFKEGQTHTQIGLVAQEAELVSPGLVTESPDRDNDGNDLGTVTKSVNYSVLYMKAVKALQEAMERIETLEAKVAALEGA